MTDRLLFERLLRENDIPLGPTQVDMLETYATLLLEMNRSINLISRRDTEHVWVAHLLHSLLPWRSVVLPQEASVLDLGTGGGLPGIPLAILRADLHVTLLDSVGKKTAAVEGFIRRLNLSRVSVVTGRAEECSGVPDLAGAFDLVVARAVAPLSDLVRWGLPFLRRDTGSWRPCLVAMKGGDVEEEIGRARLRNAALHIERVPLHLRGTDALADKLMVLVRP